MVNWFLITSAVGSTKDGLSHETRLLQTLDTLRSIKQFCPNAVTVILETTLGGLDSNSMQMLSNNADQCLHFGEDPFVQNLHAWAKGDVSLVKSPNEAMLLYKALSKISDIKPHHRIFKISGRYQLTSDFDITQHRRQASITMLRRQQAVTYYNPQNQQRYPLLTPWQYKTRLYSFSADLRGIMLDKYESIMQYFFAIYNWGIFNDIEHAIFAALSDVDVHEVDVIGVTGMQAPDQKWIRE